MQQVSGAGNVSTPGKSAVQADCLCAVEGSNETGAWFRNKPLEYLQSAFNVFSASCLSGIDCGAPITGTYRLKNAQWTQTTFANGVSYWFAAGDLDQASQLKPKMTPIPWSPVVRSMLVAVGPLPDNSLTTCVAACETADLSCFRLQGSQQITGLKALHAALLKQPAKIASNELMTMFDTDDDPCKRGDTNLANGQVSNVGDQCILKAPLPIGMDAILDMPELLNGQISVAGSEIRSEFNDPRTRARLTFTAQDKTDIIARDDADKMTSRWGGDIKAVASDGKKTVFSIGEKSCVKVTLP
ncbi:hypothetical protein HJB86_27650 [Rhizobium sp. NZLR3b]|uniref:hypothetical protein n=1 Tax=Rhizobium sp. NZLR3b TaxID=2731101 RepID=UPI001C83ACF5|nr:hypothetical protein [Rhizobium sp. NZLR3b]MBX5192617.1 hypothetical protein [Rhizobium sp. NZLR3b]